MRAMSTTALFLASILFFPPFFLPDALAAMNEKTGTDLPDTSFQVKLPDGLYMFQPRITEEAFSPLFIVKKGSLMDPYAEAQRLGTKKFHERYAEGKSFSVYTRKGLAGRLKYVAIESVTTCDFKDVLPDIRVKGRYEGRNLFAEYTNPVLYDYYKKYSADGYIKAILTPVAFTEPRAREPFDITDEDKSRAIDTVRKKLAARSLERIRMKINESKAEKKIITDEEGGELNSLNALDIDGNGFNDLLGAYSFTVEYKNADKEQSRISFSGEAVFFSLLDTGEIASLTFENDFHLGGVIDIDLDGTYELFVQEQTYTVEGGRSDSKVEEGTRITVKRLSGGAWRDIFRTQNICASIYY